MPTEIGRKMDYYDVYLGRSKEGLCCASFHDWYKLRVWILDDDDLGGKMEWVLKHHIDIHHSVSRVKLFCEENEGPWKLQDANCGEDYGQQNLQDSNNDEDGSNSAVVKLNGILTVMALLTMTLYRTSQDLLKSLDFIRTKMSSSWIFHLTEQWHII
jgi:hypothetical protein